MKQRTETVVEAMTTWRKFLKSCMLVRQGKMMRLEMRREPSNFMPSTTMMEHMTARIPRYRSTLRPMDLAKLSSKVIAKMW